VNVTPWLAVPALGAVLGVVKANVPSVLASPSVRSESAKVSPKVMSEAVGAVMMVGVALLTTLPEEAVVILTEVAPELLRTMFWEL
jgi:hypothetical protein